MNIFKKLFGLCEWKGCRNCSAFTIDATSGGKQIVKPKRLCEKHLTEFIESIGTSHGRVEV